VVEFKQSLNTKGTIMEKKTIGKFISVLRRANGMTQKELGDKLYVSDKTVSRWERDR
jgi:DNA-binding transcriptional regulator YiaG